MNPVSYRGSYKICSTDLKLYFHAGGDPVVAWDLGIPRSTVAGWRKADFSRLIGPYDLKSHPTADLFSRFLRSPTGQQFFRYQTAVADFFLSVIAASQPLKTAFIPFKNRLLDLVREFEPTMGFPNAVKLLGLSPTRFRAWVDDPDCPLSVVGKCLKRHPGQISKSAVLAIKTLLLDPSAKHWPLVSSYFKGLREKTVSCTLTTFYKYARALGFSRKNPRHRRKNHVSGLRASRPDEYWHADVTVHKTGDNVKSYIYLVVDNFSRKVLAWKASLTLSAATRMETLVEAYRRHVQGRNRDGVISLMVDGGPENVPIPAYDPETTIRKLIAQKDIVFSNSMAEAPNKILKYGYLYVDDPPDFNALVAALDKAFHDFNAVRPNGQLGGLTPDEAYSSRVPEDFIPKMKKSEERARRLAENKANLCPACT